MEDQTYFGWTNFETWQAALWMGNNYGFLESIDGKIRYSDVKAFLDRMTYEKAEQGILETGLLGDILRESKGDTGSVLALWHGLVNIEELVENHNEE